MKEKICPRCGAKFICNHDNIAKCQCAGTILTAKAREYLSQHYADCLCAKCLNEINNQVKVGSINSDI